MGSDLKGGEEKVEGVRMGLMGFEREVEGIRRGVEERQRLVGSLLEERRGVVRGVMLGRGLLEVARGVEELEGSLGIEDGLVAVDATEEFEDDDDEDEEDDLDEHSGVRVPVRRLQGHVQQYLLLSRSIRRLGAEHPFLQAQRAKMTEIKRTLLLDLGTALKQAKAAKDYDPTLAITRMFADLGAEGEGVKALKGS